MKKLTERQRFERWARRYGFGHMLDRYKSYPSEPYRAPEINSAWKAWQSALRVRTRGAA
jgi:hypothetical protein